MAMNTAAQAELCRLRRNIARIEGRLSAGRERLSLDSAFSNAATGLGPRERPARLPLGLAALDAVLGGGLPLAALHEMRASREPGRRGGQRLRAGARRAPGRSRRGVLDPLDQPGGCPARGGRSLCAGAYPARPRSRPHRRGRRAHAERGLVGLRGGAFVPWLGAAICELRQASLDLSATRRCALRAREAGVTGFLLRLGSHAEPSAAELRFRIARRCPPAPSAAFPPGSAAWPGVWRWKRTAAGRRAPSRWSGMPMSEPLPSEGRGSAIADPQPLPAAPSHRPAYPGRAEIGFPAFRRAS